jgi:hypothetical protein
LQRLQGLSDREAVEAYAFDARWRYAAGVGGYDTGGWGSFAHTRRFVDLNPRGLLTDAQDAHHGDIQGDDVIAAKRAAA